jgi:ribosomal protein S18 acetylase RimI-like enzyme
MVPLVFVATVVPIGGLHVLPDYRRRNLASIVVDDLCNQQTRFLLDHAPHADTVQYYLQSLVEYTNLGSTALFERLGFIKVGIGMTWTYISLRKED